MILILQFEKSEVSNQNALFFNCDALCFRNVLPTDHEIYAFTPFSHFVLCPFIHVTMISRCYCCRCCCCSIHSEHSAHFSQSLLLARAESCASLLSSPHGSSISLFHIRLLILVFVFRIGWNNSINNDGVKGSTTSVQQPHQQHQQHSIPSHSSGNGALASARLPTEHHRSIGTDRKRVAPVATTGMMKPRPPIETVLPKLLSMTQH